LIHAAPWPTLLWAATAALVCAVVPACDGETEVGRFVSTGCEVRAIDPAQLTALGADGRSHWLQPWRAFRDTWPAARMRNAGGFSVGGAEAPARTKLLAEVGLRRAIIGIGWNAMNFDDPTRLDSDDRDRLRRVLMAVKANGLRPLLTLDGNHVAPCPTRDFTVTMVEPAAKGARQIRVDYATLPKIVPGRSGFSDVPGTGVRADVLFHQIDTATGFVTLSKPLPADLAKGVHKGVTLRFFPFSRPRRKDLSVNPRFEDSARGFADYARAMAAEARDVLGSDDFDLEVWNELKQGSNFLDVNNYYDKPIDDGPGDAQAVITKALLDRTLTAIRATFPRIGVADGFGNTRWQIAGSTEAAGLTAIGRHISVHGYHFPADAIKDTGPALDARGRPDGERGPDGFWREAFTPTYDASFPELPLAGILPWDSPRPGQLARDLAPLVTVDQAGARHGRNTQIGAATPLDLWSTALSWSPTWAGDKGTVISGADALYLQAKAALRFLSAYVGAGFTTLFFYAPGDSLTILDWGDPTGGPAAAALKRFFAGFAGPEAVAVRPLQLLTVAGTTCGPDRQQFAGDGTRPHPPLRNAEVVAAFPFQTEARTYVVPVYVMTRNLAAVAQPALAATDPRRFDLADEVYRLTFAGLGAGVSVDASDPMTGQPVTVAIVRSDLERTIVEIAVTDSPRLLRITLP
jgi:hypothetical protein